MTENFIFLALRNRGLYLSFDYSKARLSPIVEADPDCKAAIDLLAFALYHENNANLADGMIASSHNERMDDEKRKRKRGEIESISEEEEEEETKELSEKERMRRMKERIWDELNKNGEGELALEKVCMDVEDRPMVKKALAEMEKDQRVMMGEGMVFQL